MKFFFLTFSIVLFSACNQFKTERSDKSNIEFPLKLPLAGTKWQCKITEGCINVYEFKINNNYRFYSCEMEDTFYGRYFFKQDTLILDEMGSIYDTPKDEHKITKKKYYAVIKNGKLSHLRMYNRFNNNFELSNFKFDENIYYTKNKN